MNIISIDVGEKNFAFSFLKTLQGESKTLQLEVVNVFLHNVIKKQKQTITESCIEISNLLKKYNDKILTCQLILIEQQVQPNIRAQRIAQHVWTYFYTKYVCDCEMVQIKSVSPTLKTRLFTQQDMNKNQRKKWVADAVISKNIIEFAQTYNILFIISDDILEKIKSFGKQDDVCDTIVQTITYLIKNK